ncbi:cilia- and flagella-associated protein 58-like [Mytilus edulis]|uniref:cilia- and flagella-associated protein 58-like n=1 Tax=Mytilus edulis TaxID=6550 RepID=UPI0039EEB1A2
MFLQRSLHENERQWKQIGTKNRLALLVLIDDFIKKDEEIRKDKNRTFEKTRREESDKKILADRAQKLERYKQHNTSSLSLRITQLDKRKRDSNEAASRKMRKMEEEEAERMKFLSTRIQNVKTRTHRAREKERNDALEREKQLMEAAIRKLNSIKRENKLREEKNKEQFEAMKRRVNELERQKTKASVKAEHAMHIIDSNRQQKIENSLHHFRSVERQFEQDAISLAERINNLEREKIKQREVLRQRNEKFKQEIERRRKISSTYRQNDEKWKQEYISNLKSRISKVSTSKGGLGSDMHENIADVKLKAEKEKLAFFRKQRVLHEEKLKEDENMWKRIRNMSKKKELATDTMIDAIRDIREKKKELKQTNINTEPGPEVEPEMSTREKTLLKFELEAKEREQQRIKDAFKKLMGNISDK